MNRKLTEAAVDSGFKAFALFSASKNPQLVDALQLARDAPTDSERDLRFYMLGWMDAMRQVIAVIKSKRLTIENAITEGQAAKDHFYRLSKICQEQIAACQRGELLPEGAVLETIDGLMQTPREFRDEGFFTLGWVDRLEIFRNSPDQTQRN
ncbi:MAG TPA: hypothetical protein VFO40_15585 [Chthoniobacterales bacterium]|nr:hypothetical protein [Chthoniobacterales bacterium]